MLKGQPFGTPQGVVGRNYVGLGGTSNGHKKKRQSTRGYYHIAFVKEYQGLTERDFELKLDYGRDLVSRYTNIPAVMLTLVKKTEKQTLSSLDSVYYVKRGVETIGKLSVRAQRRFADRGLVFVYSEKHFAPKELRRTSKGQQGFTTQSKSTKRQQNRNKSKPKSTN